MQTEDLIKLRELLFEYKKHVITNIPKAEISVDMVLLTLMNVGNE